MLFALSLNAVSTSEIMDQEKSSKQEIILKGCAAAPGVTIGKVYLFKKETPSVSRWIVAPEAVEREINRLNGAVERSEKELGKILDFAQQKIGDAKAKIFEAQIMVLQDQFLFDAVKKRIREELANAEYIVADEINKYSRMMLAVSDEYMHERAQEMEDLKYRIIRNL